MSTAAITVGVLSDTHGLLRPEVLAALQGSDLIIHAGDVGTPALLSSLRDLAPTRAVRGNTDKGDWADRLPLTDLVDVAGCRLYVLHDLEQLDLDPAAAGFRVVISGHSHRPFAEVRSGVLFLNPGSVGPRRFHLPVSLARLRVCNGIIRHEFVELDV